MKTNKLKKQLEEVIENAQILKNGSYTIPTFIARISKTTSKNSLSYGFIMYEITAHRYSGRSHITYSVSRYEQPDEYGEAGIETKNYYNGGVTGLRKVIV